MLNVIILSHYAESCYAECRFAECCGAHELRVLIDNGIDPRKVTKNFPDFQKKIICKELKKGLA